MMRRGAGHHRQGRQRDPIPPSADHLRGDARRSTSSTREPLPPRTRIRSRKTYAGTSPMAGISWASATATPGLAGRLGGATFGATLSLGAGSATDGAAASSNRGGGLQRPPCRRRLLAAATRFVVDHFTPYYEPARKTARACRRAARLRDGELDVADETALAALVRDRRPRAVAISPSQAGVRGRRTPCAYQHATCAEPSVWRPPHAEGRETSTISSSVSATDRVGAFREDDPSTAGSHATPPPASASDERGLRAACTLSAAGLRFLTLGPWGRPDRPTSPHREDPRGSRSRCRPGRLGATSLVDDIVDGVPACSIGRPAGRARILQHRRQPPWV